MSDDWPLDELTRRGIEINPRLDRGGFSEEAVDRFEVAVGTCLSALQTEAAVEEFGDLHDELERTGVDGTLAWMGRQAPTARQSVTQIRETFVAELVTLAVSGVLTVPPWPHPPVEGRIAKVLWWRGVRGEADEMAQLVKQLLALADELPERAELVDERADLAQAIRRGELPQTAWDEYRRRDKAERNEARMRELRRLVDEVCRPVRAPHDDGGAGG